METIIKSLEEKVSHFEKTLKTILPIFVSLQDKVKKHETRLQTIEEHLCKNKESEVNDQQLKDALTKIEVDLEAIKNNKKDESSRLSLIEESDKKRCKFWNRGYCKFKQNCPFLHPQAICIEEQCSNKNCEKRHPNICKNWQKELANSQIYASLHILVL